MLAVRDLVAGYGSIRVLNGVTFSVGRGETVALLGANGAGKTTTVMTIAGVLKARGGAIELDGRPVTGLPSFEVSRRGLAVVPEGRQVFPDLSVDENLAVGAYRHGDRRKAEETKLEILRLFPVLEQRLQQRAGTLSGGEQQMLAIGRALMARPQMLIIDELSMGLAPRVIDQLRHTLKDILATGVSALIVEQNPTLALALASRGYVMANGSIIHEGEADELRASAVLKDVYLSGRTKEGHR